MHMLSVSPKAIQKGFTLIELMISLTLGLVVMLGASQLFISVNQAYTETQRFAQLQGDLSLVSDMLAADVRAATGVTVINDTAGNSTLTLTQAGGNVVYALVGTQLNRTSGIVTEGISEQIASFSGQCIAQNAGNSCTNPVMMRLAVGINSNDGSNTRVHLVEFNVALRNNVLAAKFAG